MVLLSPIGTLLICKWLFYWEIYWTRGGSSGKANNTTQMQSLQCLLQTDLPGAVCRCSPLPKKQLAILNCGADVSVNWTFPLGVSKGGLMSCAYESWNVQLGREEDLRRVFLEEN